MCAKCGSLGAQFSVIVRATQVIAAMVADQLAVVAGQAMAACGAHLAVVVHRLRLEVRLSCTTL